MTSNALSGRRGPLRRPKVCLTAKNPGRCEPPIEPPTRTCGIRFNPEDLPVYENEEYLLPWFGCNTEYPIDLMLTPLCAAWRGEITDIESGENCVTGHEITYEAPPDAGQDYIVFRVVWPEGPACQKVLYFDVEEEP